MIWLLDLVWIVLGGAIALAGVASVRHADKLGNATIDFEMKGPIKPPSWHSSGASRRFEAGQYRVFGIIFAMIGGLTIFICLIRLLTTLFQFVSE